VPTKGGFPAKLQIFASFAELRRFARAFGGTERRFGEAEGRFGEAE
jgi:hypothetical protein